MLELRDLAFSYLKPDGSPVAETPQLDRVNLEIREGDFLLVCGPTGSGKSTLLKTLNGLSPSFTGGAMSGSVYLDGVDLTGRPPFEYAHLVGYVNQQPEGAFVADKVIDEIVYGAEQLGLPRKVIQENLDRITEILDIKDLLERDLETLSGGQQQRVAIAAALVAGQKYLLLDEPTSALDHKAATKVLRMLKELAKEHIVAVLLAEHRISRLLSEVDEMIVVHGDGTVTRGLVQDQFKDNRFAPPIIELGLKLGWNPPPIANSAATEFWKTNPRKFNSLDTANAEQKTIEIKNLQIDFDENRAIDIVELNLFSNQITAIMGENGSGKTSLCWAIQGLGEISQGSVNINGTPSKPLAQENRLDVVSLVPQRAADLLFLSTLADEFAESDRFAEAQPGTTASIFQSLTGRLDTSLHPRDLSAGQQLALVLAMQMAKNAEVLILDEPTRGLDYAAKKALAKQLNQLKQNSRTIVLASHDTEFVASVADRVVLLKQGKVIQDDSPIQILGSSGLLPSQMAQITETPGLINIEQVQL